MEITLTNSFDKKNSQKLFLTNEFVENDNVIEIYNNEELVFIADINELYSAIKAFKEYQQTKKLDKLKT